MQTFRSTLTVPLSINRWIQELVNFGIDLHLISILYGRIPRSLAHCSFFCSINDISLGPIYSFPLRSPKNPFHHKYRINLHFEDFRRMALPWNVDYFMNFFIESPHIQRHEFRSCVNHIKIGLTKFSIAINDFVVSSICDLILVRKKNECFSSSKSNFEIKSI